MQKSSENNHRLLWIANSICTNYDCCLDKSSTIKSMNKIPEYVVVW